MDARSVRSVTVWAALNAGRISSSKMGSTRDQADRIDISHLNLANLLLQAPAERLDPAIASHALSCFVHDPTHGGTGVVPLGSWTADNVIQAACLHWFWWYWFGVRYLSAW